VRRLGRGSDRVYHRAAERRTVRASAAKATRLADQASVQAASDLPAAVLEEHASSALGSADGSVGGGGGGDGDGGGGDGDGGGGSAVGGGGGGGGLGGARTGSYVGAHHKVNGGRVSVPSRRMLSAAAGEPPDADDESLRSAVLAAYGELGASAFWNAASFKSLVSRGAGASAAAAAAGPVGCFLPRHRHAL